MVLPPRVRSTRPKSATLNALPQRKEPPPRNYPSQRKNRRSENTPRHEIIRRHEKTRPDAAFIIRGTRTGKNI